MASVPASTELIQVEEVSYKKAVSEAVMSKMAGSVNGLQQLGSEPVGTVVQSILTVAQFNSIRPASAWVRMEGQSIVGSDLETVSGLSTLPDMVTDKRFLRQADADGSIMTIEADENRAHTHGFSGWQSMEFGSTVTGAPWVTNVDAVRNDGVTYSSGSESRPKNMYVNFFIKINNSI